MPRVNPEAKDHYNVRLVLEVREDLESYARMGSSRSVADLMKHMRYYDREHFVVIAVDSKLRVNAVETVSIGTLTASIVHPREAFKVPILANATGVIFVHNHPSGDATPSDEDRRITNRLEEAGNVLGIPVLDHIIIGRPDHFSFADEGIIAPPQSGYRGMVLRDKED